MRASAIAFIVAAWSSIGASTAHADAYADLAREGLTDAVLMTRQGYADYGELTIRHLILCLEQPRLGNRLENISVVKDSHQTYQLIIETADSTASLVFVSDGRIAFVNHVEVTDGWNIEQYGDAETISAIVGTMLLPCAGQFD